MVPDLEYALAFHLAKDAICSSCEVMGYLKYGGYLFWNGD
jgi:hypothetical protein